jgi:AcrR family transcriptional regulator
MDGRTKRTQRIMERIQRAALELFAAQGVDAVTMDDIAARARVSKVTVYRHFHSKEALQRRALDLYVDQVLAASEALLNSDLDFMEKLRRLLMLQLEKPAVASSQHLFELLDRDQQAGGRVNAELKRLIARFYAAGQQAGVIDDALPLELLYQHSAIYQAGFRALLGQPESAALDNEQLSKLVWLFFFGIVKRP